MITGVMDVRTERWMKEKTKLRGGVDLYEMSLPRGDIVARRPPPTAKDDWLGGSTVSEAQFRLLN